MRFQRSRGLSHGCNTTQNKSQNPTWLYALLKATANAFSRSPVEQTKLKSPRLGSEPAEAIAKIAELNKNKPQCLSKVMLQLKLQPQSRNNSYLKPESKSQKPTRPAFELDNSHCPFQRSPVERTRLEPAGLGFESARAEVAARDKNKPQSVSRAVPRTRGSEGGGIRARCSSRRPVPPGAGAAPPGAAPGMPRPGTV